VDERTGWLQRVHATLFHHGVPAAGGSLMTKTGRELLTSADLAQCKVSCTTLAMVSCEMDRLGPRQGLPRPGSTWCVRSNLVVHAT